MRTGSAFRLGTAAACFLLAAGAGAAPVRRAPLEATSVATLDGVSIFLELQAQAGDGYASLAARGRATQCDARRLETANAQRPVKAGLFYAIPIQCLDPAARPAVLLALFPDDGMGEEGWIHRVHPSDEGQTLEAIALWFAGDAGLADDLAETNGITWAPLAAGSEVVIPTSVLLPELSKVQPPPPLTPPATALPAPPPAPRAPAAPVKVGLLTFAGQGSDAHAIYRLRRGEALYSSVVARFTGRLDPDDVTATAARIAQVSGIRDVTSIPVGFPVKIPRELILPEYLPEQDPAHVAMEASLAAAQRHQLTVVARDLAGVTLILDAGHGGDDVGASRNGVHEDDYVYDIMCRIKALAEADTAASILTTIRDRSSGFRPQRGPFKIDRDEQLLTTPAYAPRQPHVSTVGVNLRWYLVNSYFRAATGRGADPQRIVFISLHADSLHPAVRGAMVYVPGQDYRGGTYGHSGRLYSQKEVGELRYVKFSSQQKERSEGLSRRLAQRLVESFGAAGLPVHKYEPVRNHVIRRGRAWSPAVIRTSVVPQSLLLEVVNLNNPQDAALMKDPVFRQKAAAAVVDALRAAYKAEPGSGGPIAARQ